MTDSFIERQFPVSKLSKESYKERTAAQSQTLTGLGKWWGRKPLILVRGAILGCLMPAGHNPKRDMEIFLKILSMDEKGLWNRHVQWVNKGEAYWEKNKESEMESFKALGYDKKLETCVRPEHYELKDSHTWNEINHHLGTSASSLQELMQQLSEKRFGKTATVGDCFCGGGSIPFEAARMGLDVYASDLNPIAGLLTWAAINISGAGEEELEEIKSFQKEIYEKVDREISALGIEHNELGDRALSYIYCAESICPECHTLVPLIPSLVVGKRAGSVVAKLIKKGNGYDIQIISNATAKEMKEATLGTVNAKGLCCPNCNKTTPITVLRKDRTDEAGKTVYGLRRWEKSDFEPSPEDVFKERLYCVRYEHVEYKKDGSIKKRERYYRAPNERDLENEAKVGALVAENLESWQEQGLVPDMEIESGDKTEELIRNRGWSHWNHLFNPRQLFVLSRFAEQILGTKNQLLQGAGILGLNKCANFGSKLCRWNPARDMSADTYYNQALNTLMNWSTRSLVATESSWFFDIYNFKINNKSDVHINDAHSISHTAHLWITDPPYADAVNYHELSEFFLAWDKRLLKEAFPDWYADSKRVLAVRGGEGFAGSMIEIYTNLTKHMPDNGMQIVMFTHSDPAVWAQLAIIMWKAGLKVTAAWNIATETDAAGLKSGNYVKGTVLLVLRKRTGTERTFLDEINGDIKTEVVSQIESMKTLDDKEDPNFSDTDYVLAAYAASLKVLTSYSVIGEIDLDYELNLAIREPEKSKVVALIDRAKKQAYDHNIPAGFDSYNWRELSFPERFYVKGLAGEKNGNYQIAAYQEYANGYALANYGQLMASEKANNCRLKTPMEFAMRQIKDVPGFENSILRLILAAIYIAIQEDEKPDKGLWHIKNNLDNYWNKRDLLKQLLEFLKDTKDISNMPHWNDSARMAEHIYVLIDNDHI